MRSGASPDSVVARRCALTADCEFVCVCVFPRFTACSETATTTLQKRQAGAHIHHVLWRAGTVAGGCSKVSSSRRRLRGARGSGGEVASTPKSVGPVSAEAEMETGRTWRRARDVANNSRISSHLISSGARSDEQNTMHCSRLCMQGTLIGSESSDRRV